jgi:hypothetical protein
VAEVASYGQINYIGNPSFEYDNITAAPAWWASTTSGGGTLSTKAVENSWSFLGNNSLRLTASLPTGATAGIVSPSSGIPINPMLNLYLSCELNALTVPTSTGIEFLINWYSGATFLGSSTNTITATGLTAYQQTATPPVGATLATISIVATNTSGSTKTVDFYLDTIQVTLGTGYLPYGDGDQIGWEWVTQKGQSSSVELVESAIQDDTTVIDSVFVDPITPNVGFNIYYSTDDTNNTSEGLSPLTETEWEQKLWTHVPQTYVTTVAQEYYLPTPMVAKYVKIEFSDLQPQSYNPGNFPIPVAYKKYPKWVADFFIGQMELPSFIASQVNVSYDALDFAYNYYLDDIGQQPAAPASSSNIPQINNFFSTLNDASDQVDPTTLQKINLVMNTYTQPPGNLADPTTLLGSVVQRATSGSAINYPVESGVVSPNVDYSDVSSLSREQIVFEQSMPVMFFYLTCRHFYRELTANFDNNKAYFAGVNSIAFMRNNYAITGDTAQYIETGGDSVNAVLNDWVLDSYGNMNTEVLPLSATPTPIDVEMQVVFYTGSQASTNTVNVFMRENDTETFTNQLDLDYFIQAELNGLPQPLTSNVPSNNWVAFTLSWGATQSLTIGNALITPYNFTGYSLTNNTYYILICSVKGTTAHAYIYPLNSDMSINPVAVLDSTAINDEFTFPRMAGSVRSASNVTDGTASIANIRQRSACFAEYISTPLNSFTPVSGGQVYANSTPNTELWTAFGAGPDNVVGGVTGSSISRDSTRTTTSESYKIQVYGTLVNQGFISNVLPYTDLTQAGIVFDLWYPSSLLNQGGTISVQLVSQDGFSLTLPMPQIVPDQWQHIVLDPPFGLTQAGNYQLFVYQPEAINGTFWVDGVSAFERAVLWSGRSVSSDSWSSNYAPWTDFRELINSDQYGAQFPIWGTQFQIRAKALTQAASIMGAPNFIPQYAQLGRLIWPEDALSGITGPTASFSAVGGSFIGTFTNTSTAGSANIILYEWNLGDGTVYVGKLIPPHTYAAHGSYNVTLTVTDAYNQRNSTLTVVTV